MKKIYWILALLMSLCMIFSAAGAYDSPWDHFSGPKANPVPTDEPVIDDPVIEEPVIEDPVINIPEITEPQPETPAVRETIADGLIWPDTGSAEPEPVITDPFAGIGNDPEPIAPDFFAETAKSGSFTIDSISISGMDDPQSRKVLDMIEGLSIHSTSQSAPVPAADLVLAFNDQDLLTYSLQKTSPYYVSSNFLGSGTYMITDEDQFEEKLVTALYSLFEKMSDGSNTSMPPLESVLDAIASIRASGSMASGGMNPMSLTQEIDPSALMNWVFSIMSRFVETDPDPAIDYRYTAYSTENFHYSWPARASLPYPAAASGATTAVFYGEDIAELFGVLQQFFADNPELAEMINQALAKTAQGAEVPGGDYLSAFLAQARENSSENMKSMVITFRMDQDENGAPIRISLDFGNEEGGNESGLVFSFTTGTDDSGSAIEITGASYYGDQMTPLFCGLFLPNPNGKGFTGNLYFGTPVGDGLELSLSSDTNEGNSGSILTDTTINYFAGENSGTVTVSETKTSNDFNGLDSEAKISLDHHISGQPMLHITASTASHEVSSLPILTQDDAIHASDLTEADYDSLAQNVFMQIMSVMMSFM